MQIQDLSKTLDTKTMTDVRGGDNGNSVSNCIGQSSALCVPVMVGTAGPTNTSVHVTGKQDSGISNDQLAGDSYVALLPTFTSIL
jgi:hypothetical protein